MRAAGPVPVTVNGEDRVLRGPTTVTTLVDSLGRGRRGVAVAVNEEIVPRSRWNDVELAPGDRVEVLTASQGG